MTLHVTDYKGKLDKRLLDLFYLSNFYKRKEFDYVRVPDNWIYRYKLTSNYFTKIALDGDRVIASLGGVTRNARVNGRRIKVCCFVDNCILPEYLDNYGDIFSKLFEAIENDARKKEVDIIQGWDFLNKVEKYRLFWNDIGYVWNSGVNCFFGGSDFSSIYPYPIKPNLSKMWKFLLNISKYYYRMREIRFPDLPIDISIRSMEIGDLEGVMSLLNTIHKQVDFGPEYTLKELKRTIKNNNIFGIIAEKDSKIIGVLTYITTAWSGGMYGRPYYHKRWDTFFSFIVDEFMVIPEYQNTLVPTYMLLKIMKIKDPEKNIMNPNNYSYIGGIFDRRIGWMKDAFLRIGCTEPAYDYGAILVKSLNDDIIIDTKKSWHLPTRCVLSPVPSTLNLQTPIKS